MEKKKAPAAGESPRTAKKTEPKAARPVIGEASPEQIGLWKARYRRVCEVVVEDGGELHAGYFHRPDMETLAAANKLRKADEIKASDVLFTNCWLGGSPLMQQEAVVKMAALGKLDALMSVESAELKNL